MLPFLSRVDLLLTDPPYGQNALDGSRTAKRYGTDRRNNWDCSRIEDDLIQLAVASALNQIVWGGNHYCHLMKPAKCFVYWHKPYAVPMKEMSDGELALTNLALPAKQFVSSAEQNKVHPTQKPLALMRWCLSLVPEAQTVLDPFMGSGTTLVAARLEGRKAVGIEISEEYCEKAVRRLAQGVLF